MKVQIPIKCPGCEFKTKIAIQKPGFMDKRVASYKCEDCSSGMMAIISRSNDKSQPREVSIKVRVAAPSPELIAMLEEEQRYKQIVQSKMIDVHGKEIRA